MSETLWTDQANEEGVSLGDPFHLLADFAEMAHACGEDYETWGELLGVPQVAFDGADADADWLDTVFVQAGEFLRRYGEKLGEGAGATLRQIMAGVGGLTELLLEAEQRKVGEVWKGPSGRWFTKNQAGRTVPAADPSKKAPAAKPKAQKLTVEQAHDLVRKAGADPRALTQALLGLKVEDVKALRAKLGQTKGSGAKQKLVDELVAKVTAAAPPKEGPKAEDAATLRRRIASRVAGPDDERDRPAFEAETGRLRARLRALTGEPEPPGAGQTRQRIAQWYASSEDSLREYFADRLPPELADAGLAYVRSYTTDDPEATAGAMKPPRVWASILDDALSGEETDYPIDAKKHPELNALRGGGSPPTPEAPPAPKGPPKEGEPGFTGKDSQGREWVNGELVAAKEEPKGDAKAKKAVDDLVGRLKAKGKITADDLEDALSELEKGKLGVDKKAALQALGLAAGAPDHDVMDALSALARGKPAPTPSPTPAGEQAARERQAADEAKAAQARQKWLRQKTKKGPPPYAKGEKIDADELRQVLLSVPFGERKAAMQAVLDQAATALAEPVQVHGMREPAAMHAVVIDGKRIAWEPDHKNVAESLHEWLAGGVPAALWHSTAGLTFTLQENKHDDHWRSVYKDFKGSRATGGSGSVCLYKGLPIPAGTMNHECGHNLATKAWGAVAPPDWSDYGQAHEEEPPVSSYGSNSPAEDFAEACRLYADPFGRRQLAKSHPKKSAALEALFAEYADPRKKGYGQ